jgi:hypothetical protein
MNPQDDAYWQSRGEDERPDDYQERLQQEDSTQQGSTPADDKP